MEKIFIFALILAIINVIECNHLAGVTELDVYTFNKTVNKYPYSFIKIDEGYPRGENHDNWGNLGKELSQVDEILIGEIRVKEHGDKLNQDLVAQWGWPFQAKEQYPQFILLVKSKSGSFDQTFYGGEFQTEEFKRFLKHKTGVYLNFPGCTQQLDELAAIFCKSQDKRQEVMDKFKADKDERAKRYLKIGHLINKRGFEALDKEEERLRKLLSDEKSASKEKRLEMTLNLNVLRSFQTFSPPSKKDEL